MGDQWLVRIDEEDGPKYLYERDSHCRECPVLVPYPEDAATFTNAAARQAIRALDRQNASAVRRFEELRARA